ncbi:Putative BTB/POZ domain-containing protein [Septoria linicola]|uniref:BTB/POZ domain-containing protein n=1 Tax=Septoria linicola TaxID=215465 RepID=A0A9Q9EK62_9PEZI|nr:putative BTB/POZ domain-containing protein [Septoria linicola]USW52919.1 Putative BTB/POZ domain-containing protein [Septoria linicola]
MALNNAKPVLDSIRGLLGDSRYADLTITCGERKWRVHKAVVCTRCEFFAKAVDRRFKESTDNIVDLEEDPPKAVAAMMRFLYTDDYDDTVDEADNEEVWKPLPTNIQVHATADKYGLTQLADLAIAKFKSHLNGIELQDMGFDEAVRQKAYGVDEGRKEPFRKCLLDCAMERGKRLVCTSRFHDLVSRVPAFAAALVAETSQLERVEEFRWNTRAYECPECDKKLSADWTFTGTSILAGYCPYCGDEAL